MTKTYFKEMIKNVETGSIKGQTLQGCHYVLKGWIWVKISSGDNFVVFCTAVFAKNTQRTLLTNLISVLELLRLASKFTKL